MAAIRLIVGLGNPGPRYAGTPHNVGADCVEALSTRFGIRLADDASFKGRIGRGSIVGYVGYYDRAQVNQPAREFSRAPLSYVGPGNGITGPLLPWMRGNQ
jgi:hypothetical protein